MHKHRVLVVGVGSIGERHVRCFGSTGRAEITICEVNPDLRQTIASRYGCSAAYPDLDAALGDAARRPDLVLIATPAQLHIPMAAQAVEAGLNILLEKPLSTSTKGVTALIESVAKRGVKAAVAYTYRAHPLMRAMREAIRSGRLGRPVQIVSVWGQHFPTYRPAYRQIYYRDRATGGGAIQDALTHPINAGEFLLGPIRRLMADAAHQVLDGVEVEDTVHVIARHGQDIMGCYSLNQYQAPNENVMTVIGDEGTARFEITRARWLTMTKPGGEWQVEGTFSLERDDLYIAQANYYLDMIEGKVEPLCTLEEAFQTLKVNLAILAAADAPAWREVV